MGQRGDMVRCFVAGPCLYLDFVVGLWVEPICYIIIIVLGIEMLRSLWLIYHACPHTNAAYKTCLHEQKEIIYHKSLKWADQNLL